MFCGPHILIDFYGLRYHASLMKIEWPILDDWIEAPGGITLQNKIT